MLDKIEMSLDDIITQNRKAKGGSGFKRRGAGAGAAAGKFGGRNTSPNKKFGGGAGGGIAKGRARGGITRSYKRVR